jgi:hypothetical protein
MITAAIFYELALFGLLMDGINASVQFSPKGVSCASPSVLRVATFFLQQKAIYLSASLANGRRGSVLTQMAMLLSYRAVLWLQPGPKPTSHKLICDNGREDHQ